MNKGCLTTAFIEWFFQNSVLLAFSAAFGFGMGRRMVCVLAVGVTAMMKIASAAAYDGYGRDRVLKD